MVTVDFLGPIGLKSMDFEASTLDELSSQIKKLDGLERWLEISAVAVNGKIVGSRNIILREGDRISLLPPVCGG
jgi:molybdopterin synthase sulfur carrier subunit